MLLWYERPVLRQRHHRIDIEQTIAKVMTYCQQAAPIRSTLLAWIITKAKFTLSQLQTITRTSRHIILAPILIFSLVLNAVTLQYSQYVRV